MKSLLNKACCRIDKREKNLRYPIMTLYGMHGKGTTEITATIENNCPEYLSGKPVTGIALYIEQWNDDDVPAMSVLISPNKQVELLCNQGFSADFVNDMMRHIEKMKDDIIDYIDERDDEYGKLLETTNQEQ